MTMRFKKLAFFVMVLLWSTLFNHVFVSNADMKNGIISEMKYIEKCSTLKGQQKLICTEVVKKRIAYCDAYKKRHEKYIESLQDARKKLSSELALQKIKQSGVKPSIAAYKSLGKGIRIDKMIKDDRAKQDKTLVKMSQNLAGTAEIMRGFKTDMKYLCKVRDIGQVDCVSLSAILAVYDNEFGKQILNDIDRLTQAWQLRSSERIIAECKPGLWVGVALTEPQLSNVEQYIADSGGVSIMNACTKVVGSLGPDRGRELAGAGGFSGITGIDSLGLGGVCGMGRSTATPSQIAANMLSQFERSCDSNSLFSSVMDGSDTQSEPDLVAIPTDSTATETVTDNGDGTETVTTTTTSGGQTSTSSYTRYRTDIPSGDSTTTVRDSKGNVKQVTTTDASGTKVSDTKYSDKGKTKTETWYDSDGDILNQERYRKQPNGSWKMTAYRIGNGKWKKLQECDLEACSQCSAMLDMMGELRTHCSSSGGRAFACQAFGEASDCCTSLGNSRVAYPNPEGSYTCSGDSDVDITEGMCSAMCSVASSEDCTANCVELTSRNNNYQFGLNDSYCIYAISDECFKSRDFGIPQKMLGRAPGPLPAPEVMPALEFLTPELLLEAAMQSGRGHIFKHVIVAPPVGKNSLLNP